VRFFGRFAQERSLFKSYFLDGFAMKHSFSSRFSASFPKVVTTVALCKIPFKSASQALSRIQQEMQTVQ
jgi:hypothetical protein